MSKIKKIACFFVLIEIVLLIAGNLYARKEYQQRSTKEYRVEINRIKLEIAEGKQISAIDLSKYPKIIRVSPFDPGEICNNEYAVEQVNGRLYRFEYKKASIREMMFQMNASYIGVIFLTIALFLYLDKKIIYPFMRMNYITTELSKGNLTVPIKQEKSKYFKDFLWGLDMLRDKLESDKARELSLLKEKKLMILSLSHDIKTPLSASDLYVKALQKDLYQSEEERCNALNGIEKNLQEIKKYVTEITNASREDFLSLEVHNSEFYLKDILLEIDHYYKGKCGQLHIDFKIEPMGNCILYGDKDRVVEVLQNVIENAIKYGDGIQIKLTGAEEEDCKLISVTNTGCTLKEEELPHVFDSFYRAANAERIDGSGLGLYICKQLMHMMDGDIFAKIPDDTFAVTLVLKKM